MQGWEKRGEEHERRAGRIGDEEEGSRKREWKGRNKRGSGKEQRSEGSEEKVEREEKDTRKGRG